MYLVVGGESVGEMSRRLSDGVHIVVGRFLNCGCMHAVTHVLHVPGVGIGRFMDNSDTFYPSF